jgi:hypothetical protein
MKRLYAACLITLALTSCQKTVSPEDKTGTLKITFINSVKGNPVGLGSTVHTNAFGEQYTITKFKYYVSGVNAFFSGMASATEKESYYLVDESKPTSLTFSFAAKANKYQVLQFMLGVDSARNVSGAQTGALDPLNDMFWTWNSGYIMAKLEGTSPQSTVVNNKIEYHIGGFSGVNNTLNYIPLNMPGNALLDIREGKTTEVIIEADIDKWWQMPNDLKIATNAVCHDPGALAKKFADNYSDMFTVKNVINN